jgi:hypothetical protein
MEIKNINGVVYCPRAVAYCGTEHADEGGGGPCISIEAALALGATEIEFGPDGYAWAKWPQHYWELLK